MVEKNEVKEQKIEPETKEFTVEELKRFKSEQDELIVFKQRTEKERDIINTLYELKKNHSNIIDGKPAYLSMEAYYELTLQLDKLNLLKNNYFYDQELLKLDLRIKSYEPVFEKYKDKLEGELNE